MNELGNAAQWTSAVIALLSVCIATIGLVISVRTAKSKAHDEKFEKLKADLAKDTGAAGAMAKEASKQVERLDIRVTRVEDEMRHLPDKDATHRIELALVEMRGDMKAMSPIVEMVHRIHESMLEKAG